jgi:hypothetical protein
MTWWLITLPQLALIGVLMWSVTKLSGRVAELERIAKLSERAAESGLTSS